MLAAMLMVVVTLVFVVGRMVPPAPQDLSASQSLETMNVPLFEGSL